MTKKELLTQLITWRTILLIFASVGLHLLPFGDRFPYRESVLEPYGHPLLYSWANFDGVHYLGIAAKGYFADFTQAFFPFYPLLINWLNHIVHHYLLSGLLISHISLFYALHYLYKLVKLDLKQAQAQKVITYLFLFPTSFYFGSYYTESLFFLFVITTFYAIRTKHTLRAIVIATLASATKVIGVFLIPALIIEKFSQLKTKKAKKNPVNYLPFIFPIVGLISYMYYLHHKFFDAFYFLNAQPAFGAQRSSDKIILIYQVIYRYIRMLITVEPLSFLYYTVNQEFWISLIFLALCLIAFTTTRKSYATFALLSFIAPTLTGTFSSMPRYVLVLFPCFMVLAQIKNKKFTHLWLTLSVILLFINTVLFTRGYWVA